MQISYDRPPHWRQFEHYFPDFADHKPVFCYDKIIYNPFNIQITPDLLEHESIHMLQQKRAPDAWWIRYMTEPAFRLEQEIEAYRAQYKYVAKRVKDREALFWYSTRLAEALSSSLYGNLISKAEARKLIKSS